MIKYTLIPDYSPYLNKLNIVYPLGLVSPNTRSPRESLLDFFYYFLDTLNCHERGLKVNILVQKYPHSKRINKNNYPNLQITFVEIECQDVWIRDWAAMPVLVNVPQKNKKFTSLKPSEVSSIKTVYDPTYCPVKQETDNEAGLKLAKSSRLRVEYSNLKWDLGNFTTNGDSLIITEKFIEANAESGSEDEIGDLLYLLKDKFSLTNVVVLPVEENDMVGHIDSICRFIDNHTVVIPQYPNESDYEGEYNYIQKIKEILKKCLPLIDVLEIPSDVSDKMNPEEIYSAEGCYVNYFRVGNNLYIPQYNIYEDDQALTVFKRYSRMRNPELNLIPINNSNKLAYLGGVLNCFTNLTIDS